MPNLLLLMTISLYGLWVTPVAALSLDLIDKLDIKAIKSIHLKQTETEFRAQVVVQFSTLAPTAIKFRDANFVITFKDDQEQIIHLGTTQSAELLFPASEDGHEQLKDERLDVVVGQNDIKTVQRLIHLFNLIGNPNAEFSMILSGTTEVGVQAKQGWFYQGRIEIEGFTFHPTIQREVLFK